MTLNLAIDLDIEYGASIDLPGTDEYFLPGGVDKYLRPGGVDQYYRPFGA